MWEYKRLKRTGNDPEDIIQMLNELGRDGWEVIQYEEEDVTFNRNRNASYLVIFKRKISNNKVL